MIIVTYLLLALEVIVAILLVLVILMQKSKGGIGAIGGGASEAILGAGAGNVLTKATVILGITFLVNTLLIAIIYSNQAKTSMIGEGVPVAPTIPAPGGLPGTAPPGTAPPGPSVEAPGPVPVPVTPAPTPSPVPVTPAPAPAPAPAPVPVTPSPDN